MIYLSRTPEFPCYKKARLKLMAKKVETVTRKQSFDNFIRARLNSSLHGCNENMSSVSLVYCGVMTQQALLGNTPENVWAYSQLKLFWLQPERGT